jgi:hypothetical protein
MPNPDGTATPEEAQAAADAARQKASNLREAGLTGTIDETQGGFTVSPPELNTPGDVAQQILGRIKSGQPISTEQAVSLRTALAAVQGIEGQKLRQDAAATLRTDAGNLNNLTIGAIMQGADSIARERTAAQGANAADQRAVSGLGVGASQANATDRGLIAQLGQYGANTDAQNRAIAGEMGNELTTSNLMDLQGLQQLQGATGDTNDANKAALQSLLQGGKAANATDSDTIAALNQANKDVGYYGAANYGPDVVSKAGQAAADPRDIAAQHEVMDQLAAESTGALTPQESYNMELARRNEEQDRRAALEATLSNLGARGIRSGGAEIGALLGSEQNTAQTRAIQDQAALAAASQRAIQAQEARGNLSTGSRGQSFTETLQPGQAQDAVSQFNKTQGLTQQNYQQQQAAQQAQAGFGRAQQVAATTLGNTQDVYGRAQDATKAGQSTNQTNLGNEQANIASQQNRSDAYTNKAKTMADTALGVTAAGQGIMNNYATAAQGANAADYGRNKDVVGAQTAATQQGFQRTQGTEADQRASLKDALSGAGQSFDAASQAANISTGQAAQPVAGALGDVIAKNEADRAEANLTKDPSLLGLIGV